MQRADTVSVGGTVQRIGDVKAAKDRADTITDCKYVRKELNLLFLTIKI